MAFFKTVYVIKNRSYRYFADECFAHTANRQDSYNEYNNAKKYEDSDGNGALIGVIWRLHGLCGVMMED